MNLKKIIVLGIFILMGGVCTKVDAANFVISAPSSANVNTNFTVSISHSGDAIGSLQMQIAITNAECSVQSTCSGGVANCNGGSCLTSFNLANGLKAGNNIITLSCRSAGGSAKFTASVANKDAWDVEGMKQLTINSASKSVTINGTTATTKKTTTQSTISKRPTTARTTKSTTKSTTTKKTTSTSTKTTKKSNSSSTSTTTRFITTHENMPYSTTTSETTSTASEMTTEEPTTAYVPDDLKLRELKIVGYNINFKPNLSSYTIDVDEKVDELYIIASPADEQTEIETVGLVDIAGKDYIQIRVFNDNAKHEINYKINIRRTKSNTESSVVVGNIFSDSFKLIVFAMLAVIFFLILFFTVKGLMKRSKDYDDRDDSQEYTNSYTNNYANNYTNAYTNEYTNEDTEELIPKSEEELKTLFDELDKEQRK